MTKIPETKNEDYGFYGTTRSDYPPTQTEKRWAVAFTTLKKLSKLPNDVIRRFLDSRSGKHLASSCFDEDDVANIIKTQWKWLQKELFSKDYEVSDEEFYNNH